MERTGGGGWSKGRSKVLREKGWTERLIQRLTFENEAREKAKKRVSRGRREREKEEGGRDLE